jgi:hypothetical protein
VLVAFANLLAELLQIGCEPVAYALERAEVEECGAAAV